MIIDMEPIIAKKEQWIRDNMKEGLALHILTDHSDPASEVYMRKKKEKCEEFGVECKIVNKTKEVGKTTGVMVQLPTQDPDLQYHSDKVPWYYDVDALGQSHSYMNYSGNPQILPCTVQGCMDIINNYYDDVRGLKILVIGRSALVGKPLTVHLINQGANVTCVNSTCKEREVFDLIQTSDIVVCATGQHGVVMSTWFTNNQLVIDVGITRNAEGKLVGDVYHVQNDDPEFNARITPVPGGVGRLTVLNVIGNLVKLNKENCQ